MRVSPEGLELYSVMSLTAMDQIIVCFRVTLTEQPVITAGEECLAAALLLKDETVSLPLAGQRHGTRCPDIVR